MKEWSKSWANSKQPRKQRKFRHNAPLHVRRKFLSAHLSVDLRRQYGRRSFPLRKGDEVVVQRGKFKGTKGEVTSLDLSKNKVHVDGVNIKKVDGSEAAKPIQPSNLIITKVNLDDKKRRMAMDRAKKSVKTEKPVKEVKKEVTKEVKKEEKVSPKK